MTFTDITYRGVRLTDHETHGKLPDQLKKFLDNQNGIIAFGGGLHIRSCSLYPEWNSLRRYWTGDQAFHRIYEELKPTDIPFGQDCVGDQFFLRESVVHRLSCETGDTENLDVDFNTFLEKASSQPDEYLLLSPLRLFEQKGNKLMPGELLSVFPLFCMSESKNGISVKAISIAQRIDFLKHVYEQIKNIPDGASFEIKVTKD